MSNIQIGSLNDNYFSIGAAGQIGSADTYFFSLPTMGSARISAIGFSGDINMELQNKEGKVIKNISTSDTKTGIINIDNLGAADYILKISPVTGYTKDLSQKEMVARSHLNYNGILPPSQDEPTPRIS